MASASSSSSPSARRRRELERLYSPVRAREFRPLAARTTARREDDGAAVETTETVMVADRGVRITRDAGRGTGTRGRDAGRGGAGTREDGEVRERDGHHERFRLLGRLVLAVGAVSSLFFFSSADSAASASSSLALR